MRKDTSGDPRAPETARRREARLIVVGLVLEALFLMWLFQTVWLVLLALVVVGLIWWTCQLVGSRRGAPGEPRLTAIQQPQVSTPWGTTPPGDAGVPPPGGPALRVIQGGGTDG